MDPANHYRPPRTPAGGEIADNGGARTRSGWVACPQCHSLDVAMPRFTWWGGMAGQKLLTHVKCNACGHTYNGNTGESNAVKIAIYQGVALVIALGVVYLLYM